MTDHSRRRDRAVLRGAFATLGSRLVTTATSFITLGIAARELTRDEFGLVAFVVSGWLILTMFDLGIGGALITRVARSHAAEDPVAIRLHMNHGLLAMSAIGAVVAASGAVCSTALPWADWIGGRLEADDLHRSILIGFVLAGASFPASVAETTLAAMQRFSAARWSPALGGISTVVIMAALTPTRPGPPLVIGTILGCPLVVSAVYLGWVRFAILGAHRPRRAWQRSELVSMLLASSWYAGYTAANTLTLGSGTVIVGAVRGATDAGLYSVASRLLAPIITVIASSGMLLRPGMTEAISRGDVDWARSRYRRGLVLITGVSLALAMIVVAIGPWIGRLWVGPDLAPSRTLLIWVSAFTVTAAVTYQVTGLLMALERVRVAALLAVCAALVSLVSSVVLTRDLGPLGAAVGGLIGSLGVLLPGVAWLARRALNSLEPHVGHPAATS